MITALAFSIRGSDTPYILTGRYSLEAGNQPTVLNTVVKQTSGRLLPDVDIAGRAMNGRIRQKFVVERQRTTRPAWSDLRGPTCVVRPARSDLRGPTCAVRPPHKRTLTG